MSLPDVVSVTIDGSATASHPAELAVLRITTRAMAYNRTEASVALHHLMAPIETAFEHLRTNVAGDAAAAITRWNGSDVKTFSDHAETGLAVYTAVATSWAEFRNFDIMARTVHDIRLMGCSSVDWVDWTLTAQKKTEVMHELREKAVADAMDKAEAYRKVLGKKKMKKVEVSSDGEDEIYEKGEISYGPENVCLQVRVKVRFEAS
ncbi:hypothetical protein BJY04DRAFT_27663 [Aspergillus karnatakaensis]|uniref:SIMPL domain-containing protein n=1 Tax=Aspergillus karnatakaensis TaxID=1810916 RepID=UPI003CCDBFAE